MPEPTPEMLALEAQLESLGDWRAQLDDELAQMAGQIRRINRLASSGARNDTPARPRHAPAATGDAPEGPAAQPAGEGGWKPGLLPLAENCRHYSYTPCACQSIGIG